MASRSRSRRAMLQLLCGAGAAGLAAKPMFAQSLPDAPIRIVSPYTAGGLGDTLPRLVAMGLGESLGRQVIVENIPGASQLIGAQTVARSPPDGATLLFASSTSMGINVAASKSPPYEPLRDFAPICVAFSTPLYLVVNPRVKAESVAELVALAKASPGKLTFASGGVASSNHLAGEMFKSLTGVNLVHVPYKGTGPALNDLVAGHVDLMFAADGAEQARQGSLRALAITDATRSKAFPDIPTMREAGVPGYELSIWFGFVAPAGTPKPTIDMLAGEIHKALASPALRRLASGVEITPSTPEEMSDRIARDLAMWRNTIRDAHVEMQQ